MANPLSGLLGKIEDASGTITQVRDWSIDETADVKSYASSNTDGGMGRLTGNIDYTGQYNAYGHTPEILPGNFFTFTGAIDDANGVSTDTDGCIVDSFVINWGIEAGDVISHTVSFSGTGVLSRGAAVVTEDTTLTIPPTSIGTKAELGTIVAVPVFTEILNITAMSLTVSSANTAYTNSGTAGRVKRLKGLLDAIASITVQTDDFSNVDIPTINEEGQLRMYVDATTYWDLKWMKCDAVADAVVDVETAAVVGVTLNFGMMGFADVAGTPTKGFLANPATTNIWPPA